MAISKATLDKGEVSWVFMNPQVALGNCHTHGGGSDPGCTARLSERVLSSCGDVGRQLHLSFCINKMVI